MTYNPEKSISQLRVDLVEFGKLTRSYVDERCEGLPEEDQPQVRVRVAEASNKVGNVVQSISGLINGTERHPAKVERDFLKARLWHRYDIEETVLKSIRPGLDADARRAEETKDMDAAFASLPPYDELAAEVIDQQYADFVVARKVAVDLMGGESIDKAVKAIRSVAAIARSIVRNTNQSGILVEERATSNAVIMAIIARRPHRGIDPPLTYDETMEMNRAMVPGWEPGPKEIERAERFRKHEERERKTEAFRAEVFSPEGQEKLKRAALKREALKELKKEHDRLKKGQQQQ